jgi:hypothetical protein
MQQKSVSIVHIGVEKLCPETVGGALDGVLNTRQKTTKVDSPISHRMVPPSGTLQNVAFWVTPWQSKFQNGAQTPGARLPCYGGSIRNPKSAICNGNAFHLQFSAFNLQ